MTSTPVMGSFITPDLQGIGAKTQSVGGKDGMPDFKSMMENASKTATGSGKETKTEVKKSLEDTKAETVETKNKPETDGQKDVSEATDVKHVENKAQSAEKTVEEAEEAVCKELDITKEELEEALSVMGLTVMALLSNEKLPEIVAYFTGNEDVISLAMDEDAFATMEKVSGIAEKTVNELAEMIDTTPEEIQAAVKELADKTEEKSIPATYDEVVKTVTDSTKNVEKVSEEQPEKLTFEDKIEVRNKNSEAGFDRNAALQNTEEKAENISLKDAGQTKNESEHNSFANNSQTMNFAQAILDRATQIFNETREASELKYSSFEVENILNQITDSIKADISPETSEINLRLHPESLGTVNVKLSATHEGVVTATFTAQNEAVKAIIESQAIVLKETLEAKGTTVEAIEVLVQSHEFERNLENQNRGEAGEGKPGKRTVRRINLTEEVEGTVDAEEAIVREMMALNGSTIDYSA